MPLKKCKGLLVQREPALFQMHEMRGSAGFDISFKWRMG